MREVATSVPSEEKHKPSLLGGGGDLANNRRGELVYGEPKVIDRPSGLVGVGPGGFLEKEPKGLADVELKGLEDDDPNRLIDGKSKRFVAGRLEDPSDGELP